MYKIKISEVVMSTALKNIIINMGVIFLEELTKYSLNDIYQIRGIGKKKKNELINILSEYNLSLKPCESLHTLEKRNQDEIKKRQKLIEEITDKPLSYDRENQLKYLCKVLVKYLSYTDIREAAELTYGIYAQ